MESLIPKRRSLYWDGAQNATTGMFLIIITLKISFICANRTNKCMMICMLFVFVLACFRYQKWGRALSGGKVCNKYQKQLLQLSRLSEIKWGNTALWKQKHNMSFKFKYALAITITIQQNNMYMIQDSIFKMFIQGYSRIYDTNNNKERNPSWTKVHRVMTPLSQLLAWALPVSLSLSF